MTSLLTGLAVAMAAMQLADWRKEKLTHAVSEPLGTTVQLLKIMKFEYQLVNLNSSGFHLLRLQKTLLSRLMKGDRPKLSGKELCVPSTFTSACI